nr:M23 family metallopeptidase [Cylindrospermum sp. FACHB-282]
MARRFASTLPAQSLCWLSGFSLLSGGFVFAQADTSIDNIVPTIENSQPTAVKIPVIKHTAAPEAATPQSDFSERRARLKKRLSRANVSQSTAPVRASKPKIAPEEPGPVVIFSRPRVETSRVAPSSHREAKPKAPARTLPEKLPEVAQPVNDSNSIVRATAGKNKDYNNAYIDPTDYNSASTGNYQAPNSVVLTERSSGCRTILSSGQGVSGGACAKAPETTRTRVANSEGKSAPSWLRRSENASLSKVSPVRQLAANVSNVSSVSSVSNVSSVSSGNGGWRGSRIGSGGTTKSAYHPNRFIPNPREFATTTVSASPIAPSGGTLPAPMADGNVAPRPSTVSYEFSLASVLPQIPYTGAIAYRGGGAGMVFPLSVPAPITSLFGWRVHPITGDRRFHAGTDLGAPTGTPVLAAAKGQVETADWMGGYGLAVVINHNSAQQTLYAHMSEIFVQPGQQVEPGTVIGRVGSTGNSTGPHLHFEVRHLTQDGWVAADPGVQLQSGLSQLVQSLQTAQVSQKPDS